MRARRRERRYVPRRARWISPTEHRAGPQGRGVAGAGFSRGHPVGVPRSVLAGPKGGKLGGPAPGARVPTQRPLGPAAQTVKLGHEALPVVVFEVFNVALDAFEVRFTIVNHHG